MTEKRKTDHLKICLGEKVEAGCSGLADIELKHMALPELDFDKIDTNIKFLGKKLKYPIIIEALSGGVAKAAELNKDVASVAEKFGVGFGVGSQRMAIEDGKLADTYLVRDVAPKTFLIANLGAVQLNYGYGLSECKKAIEMIDADALALHVNPLQEAIQPEGDRNFSGLIEKINSIAKKLDKPVIVKEVGSGISYETAKRLRVSAFDVGGSGGTSWSLIEGLRGDEKTKKLGAAFAEWGIPTAESILEVTKLGKPVVGSGGIRSGIDAAKAIALGADCVGVALPVLRAWGKGGRMGVESFLEEFISELKVAMFLTGSANVRELRGKVRT
jgi:isopentenyl-diphosphate delta-isomerase